MKKEEFCEILGQVGEAYVPRARKPLVPRWTRWAAAAACLMIVGLSLYHAFVPGDFRAYLSRPRIGAANTAAEWTVVDQSIYEKVLRDDRGLEAYLGQVHSRDDGGVWYFPENIEDRKYLIRHEEGGVLTLWRFVAYEVSEGETYTYGDVLERIYGVTGPEDIVSITTSPSRGNNTDQGRKIQREVGTRTYTDRADIRAIYEILTEVVCLGIDSEPTTGEDRFTYSFTTTSPDKLTSGETAYGTRVLTIELESGTTIDSWRYDALRGAFFEYNAIFTVSLSDGDVKTLNEIFGIR